MSELNINNKERRVRKATNLVLDEFDIAPGTEDARKIFDRYNRADDFTNGAGEFQITPDIPDGEPNANVRNILNDLADFFSNLDVLIDGVDSFGIGLGDGLASVRELARFLGDKFRQAARELAPYFRLPEFDGFNPVNSNFPRSLTDRDPLVLDLNTGDVSLRSLALSEAFFDLDSNGFAEKTGWIQPGEGLLALDANGNGRIDNGSELFGTPTVDGFTILSQYDSNGDNQITSADAIWDSLLIWRDDGDAISTSAELTNITSEDIVSIDLNDVRPGRFDRTREGNTILRASSFEGADGFEQEVVAVGFRTDSTNTRFVVPDDFEYDPDVFTLPNLRSYGELPDLWTAMTLDPELKLMVQNDRNCQAAPRHNSLPFLYTCNINMFTCGSMPIAANGNGELSEGRYAA